METIEGLLRRIEEEATVDINATKVELHDRLACIINLARMAKEINTA